MCRLPLLLALAALLALVPASHSLKCYQCSDAPDSGLPLCSELDEGDDRFKLECPVSSIHTCSKVSRSDGQVIRGCYGEGRTEACTELNLGAINATECFCTSDYCNSAGLTKPALLLLVPAALMAAFYKA